MEDPCERVHVGETVWNFVLVIGLLDCGTMDTLIAFALMIGNAMMQALFCIAIMSPEFRGTAFASQLAVAKKWRLGVGHDSTYMDSTPTSLVARVCGSDETLIVANSQATLVRDITAYLGFDNADGSSWFSPGALLSTLCILHWCLYIFEEIRSICSTMHAISNVPRDQKSEMRGGRLIRISYFRFLSYFLLTVIRSCIAAVLLYAGDTPSHAFVAACTLQAFRHKCLPCGSIIFPRTRQLFCFHVRLWAGLCRCSVVGRDHLDCILDGEQRSTGGNNGHRRKDFRSTHAPANSSGNGRFATFHCDLQSQIQPSGIHAVERSDRRRQHIDVFLVFWLVGAVISFR